MQFTKPPTSFDEQVVLLESRGMIIGDSARARKYLSHLNYYRLAAYWLPFEETHSPHCFKEGTTFNTVLEHYIFDRELRLLVIDAIERIEVSLRTQWAYHLSHAYGPHAHLRGDIHTPNKRRWNYQDNIAKLRVEVQRSTEVFIRHFMREYDEELPPLWAVCEVMTLGELSRWFANLKHSKDRNAIARVYGLDERILTSFLHHLSVVRNNCAHHARLWNREFTFTLILPKKTPPGLYPNFNPEQKRRLYNTLVMIAYMMDTINRNTWKQRLYKLFENHPDVDCRHLGFPTDWLTRPLWKSIEAA